MVSPTQPFNQISPDEISCILEVAGDIYPDLNIRRPYYTIGDSKGPCTQHVGALGCIHSGFFNQHLSPLQKAVQDHLNEKDFHWQQWVWQKLENSFDEVHYRSNHIGYLAPYLLILKPDPLITYKKQLQISNIETKEDIYTSHVSLCAHFHVGKYWYVIVGCARDEWVLVGSHKEPIPKEISLGMGPTHVCFLNTDWLAIGKDRLIKIFDLPSGNLLYVFNTERSFCYLNGYGQALDFHSCIAINCSQNTTTYIRHIYSIGKNDEKEGLMTHTSLGILQYEMTMAFRPCFIENMCFTAKGRILTEIRLPHKDQYFLKKYFSEKIYCILPLQDNLLIFFNNGHLTYLSQDGAILNHTQLLTLLLPSNTIMTCKGLFTIESTLFMCVECNSEGLYSEWRFIWNPERGTQELVKVREHLNVK